MTHFLLPALITSSLDPWLSSSFIVLLIFLDLATWAALELYAASLSLEAASRPRSGTGCRTRRPKTSPTTIQNPLTVHLRTANYCRGVSFLLLRRKIQKGFVLLGWADGVPKSLRDIGLQFRRFVVGLVDGE